MMWVVVERARTASRWGREGKRSLRVKVVSRDSCALQRPCVLGAPVAAVVEFAGARAAAAAAAHDEDADRRFIVDGIWNVFEPAVEPAQLLVKVALVAPDRVRAQVDVARK